MISIKHKPLSKSPSWGPNITQRSIVVLKYWESELSPYCYTNTLDSDLLCLPSWGFCVYRVEKKVPFSQSSSPVSPFILGFPLVLSTLILKQVSIFFIGDDKSYVRHTSFKVPIINRRFVSEHQKNKLVKFGGHLLQSFLLTLVLLTNSTHSNNTNVKNVSKLNTELSNPRLFHHDKVLERSL